MTNKKKCYTNLLVIKEQINNSALCFSSHSLSSTRTSSKAMSKEKSQNLRFFRAQFGFFIRINTILSENHKCLKY